MDQRRGGGRRVHGSAGALDRPPGAGDRAARLRARRRGGGGAADGASVRRARVDPEPRRRRPGDVRAGARHGRTYGDRPTAAGPGGGLGHRRGAGQGPDAARLVRADVCSAEQRRGARGHAGSPSTASGARGTAPGRRARSPFSPPSRWRWAWSSDAQRSCEDARRIFQDLGEHEEALDALAILGDVALYRGDLPRALAVFDEMATAPGRVGYQRADIAVSRSVVYLTAGMPGEAVEVLQELLDHEHAVPHEGGRHPAGAGPGASGRRRSGRGACRGVRGARRLPRSGSWLVRATGPAPPGAGASAAR